MRKVVTALICILWLFVVGIPVVREIQSDRANAEYTIENDGVTLGDYYYIADNTVSGGVVYQMDTKANVSHLYVSGRTLKDSSVVKLAVIDAKVHVLLSATGDTGAIYYQLVTLDQEMKVSAISSLLQFEQEGSVSTMTGASDSLYIGMISEDGLQALLYAVALDSLTDLTAEDAKAPEGITSLAILDSTVSEDDGYIVKAYYAGGELSTLSDAQLGSNGQAPNGDMVKLYNAMYVNLWQIISIYSGTVLAALVIFLVGIAAILLLSILLQSRNRGTVVAVMTEIFLVAVIVVACVVTIYGQKSSERNDFARYASYSMKDFSEKHTNLSSVLSAEDFYHTNEYRSLQQELRTAVKDSGMKEVFDDLLIVEFKTGKVVVSAFGENGMKLSDIYTSAVKEPLEAIRADGSTMIFTVQTQGKDRTLVAAPVGNEPTPSYALVAATDVSQIGLKLLLNYRSILIPALIVLVLGTLVLFISAAAQSADLSRLGAAMKRLASGDTHIERPVVQGKDMNMLWNNLAEVGRTVEKVHYSNYLMFEAYYRFAPKHIEKILKKHSITEVSGGDTIRLNGTVALIANSRSGMLAYDREGALPDSSGMDRMLQIISDCQEKQDGILVSSDSNLSLMKMLFLEESKNSSLFGIDFHQQLDGAQTNRRMSQATTLLHYSELIYGVAGTAKQSMPFLLSKEVPELEKYVRNLRKAGLRLVVTEAVKERETIPGKLRYIGYLELESTGKQLKLYEVLAACPERVNRGRMDTAEQFEKALQLFYEQDFYLARRGFTDVLKLQPEDYLCKWYLFTCEKYLNETDPDKIKCSLNGLS